MLGTEVDSVVTDLAVDPFRLRLKVRGGLGLCGCLVGQMCECRIRRDESGSLVAGRLRVPTGKGRRYRTGISGEGRGAKTELLGRTARQTGERGSHSGYRKEG
jgi:hypothetical protein